MQLPFPIIRGLSVIVAMIASTVVSASRMFWTPYVVMSDARSGRMILRTSANSTSCPSTVPGAVVDDNCMLPPLEIWVSPSPRAECRADDDGGAKPNSRSYSAPTTGRRIHDIGL